MGALILATGCGEVTATDVNSTDVPEPQSAAIDLSDAELAVLVPDYLDAESMAWFEGVWGVAKNETFEAASCQSGGFMTATGDGSLFAMTVQPEPESGKTAVSNGRVRLSRGEEIGVFNLTPPDWDDAYFRLKPRSKARLSAQLYMFDGDRAEWLKRYDFEFERCP